MRANSKTVKVWPTFSCPHGLPKLGEEIPAGGSTRRIVLVYYETYVDTDDPTRPLSHPALMVSYTEGKSPSWRAKSLCKTVDFPRTSR